MYRLRFEKETAAGRTARKCSEWRFPALSGAIRNDGSYSRFAYFFAI
jgi:hypothetical protein